MSSGLFTLNNLLLGAGALVTAGIVAGVAVTRSGNSPSGDETLETASNSAETGSANPGAANSPGNGAADATAAAAENEPVDAYPLCPEDMRGIAESRGGLEACGTGFPPPGDTNPLNGIWRVESPGNPKVDALMLYVNYNHGILRRENPNIRTSTFGVWRMKGADQYGQNAFAVRLNRDESGMVSTGIGGFGYCNCRQIIWRVRPTGNPNVMVGEWEFEGDRGASIWRRRSGVGVVRSVAISAAYQDESGAWATDQFDYGERPGVIRRSHPVTCGYGHMRGNCDGLWVTVFGDNFAGAHEVWLDPATHIELDGGQWICKDGQSVNGNWNYCGVAATPGENVAGIKLRLIFWDGMKPGPINIWVDGQPIPINVILDGYSEEKDRPELVSLEALDTERNEVTEIAEGAPFILEARFDANHPDPWVNVEIPLNTSGAEAPPGDAPSAQRALTVTLQRMADNRTFRSAQLAIEAEEETPELTGAENEEDVAIEE